MVPVLCITIPILSYICHSYIRHLYFMYCSSFVVLYYRISERAPLCLVAQHIYIYMQYFTCPQTNLFCCEAVDEGRQMKCKGHVVSCDRNASTVVSIIFAYKIHAHISGSQTSIFVIGRLARLLQTGNINHLFADWHSRGHP